MRSALVFDIESGISSLGGNSFANHGDVSRERYHVLLPVRVRLKPDDALTECCSHLRKSAIIDAKIENGAVRPNKVQDEGMRPKRAYPHPRHAPPLRPQIGAAAASVSARRG